MSKPVNKTYGRTPDDPDGSRISMHIRMRPSVKNRLRNLSERTGRTMIDILESGVAVQESQQEFNIVSDSISITTATPRPKVKYLSRKKLKTKKTTRVNGGTPTNNLVLSCYQESNNAIFPHILKLFVSEGSTIADCTYGKGVFWKDVDQSKYECFFSDLKKKGIPEIVKGGVDSRRLPYGKDSLDALVFDPPYMHTPGGTAHNGHQNFEQYYANNAEIDEQVAKQIWEETNGSPPKYHEAVLDLYFRSAREAYRVLKAEGIYIVKCQDEVCANRNRFTHVEIMYELSKYGFNCVDLFVVMRNSKPGVSRLKNSQVHARKNHSYFLVFRKKIT